MKIECSECAGKSKLIRCDGESLYCICLEPNCGHSFVSSIIFKHTIKFPINGVRVNKTPYMENNYINCGCGYRAKILKTNRLSLSVADMYCECNHCQHRFVLIRSYDFSLSPSAKQANTLAHNLVRSLTPAARVELRRQLDLFQ